MELWIRSQDREELLKVDNIRIKHEYEQKKVNDNYGRTCAYINGNYRCSYIYSDSTCLGEYKTKERALEVLDEIQEILSCKCLLKSYDNLTPEFSDNITIQPCEVHIEQLNNYVYEMPKE